MLFIICGLWAFPAAAAEQWYVEFSDASFEESVVRRAVALELREVEIPGDPRLEDDTSESVSLRILVSREDGALSVGLWDRGEYVGRRRVSSSTQARVLARRVGLAVGELGRQLAARRYREAQERDREAFLAEENEEERKAAARLQDIGLRADANLLLFPRGGYLLGPGLGAEFNQYHPLRFNVGLSWLAGGLPTLADDALGNRSPRWSSFDLWLHADHVRVVDSENALSLGVLAAVSAIHVGGATEVDEIPLQRDSYSARLGGRVGWQFTFSQLIRARVEASVGSVLRSIPIRHGTTRLDLGGGFFGLNVGATIAPPSSAP